MNTTIRRMLWLVLGWALVVLGFVGLFVPILQGILLILLGLWVLSRESLWARRVLYKLRRRYPAADRRMRELQLKFRRFGGRGPGTGDDSDPEKDRNEGKPDDGVEGRSHPRDAGGDTDRQSA